jgi:hypothetical protein
MNLGKVIVESGKGDLLHMIKEISEQISWLEEEANRAKAKLLELGQDCPLIHRDAHAQHLMHWKPELKVSRRPYLRGLSSL